MVSEETIFDALRNVKEPRFGFDLVTLNMVHDLKIDEGAVSFSIIQTISDDSTIPVLMDSVQDVLKKVPGVTQVKIDTNVNITSENIKVKDNLLPGVKNAVAVSSGKGGVGKTTVAVNLAVALSQSGAKVGIMDADIYGPNVPMMMGITTPPTPEGERLRPAVGHNVKIISMAFFVSEDTPMIWRGPMIHGAIQQFLRDVDWGELDYLIVDLPPGTGDAQLSITQLLPLTGSIIVTTPQGVALLDSKKGLAMFKKVNVPVFGIIENMSYFDCPHCNQRTDIFSHGGGREAAEKLGVPFLGEVPIDPAIRQGGDNGMPFLVSQPTSTQALAFLRLTRSLAAQISVQKKRASQLNIIM